MNQLDFDNTWKVYFCGIGGISMSGLAAILLDEGFSVSGSDRSESDLTKALAAQGAKIYIGQKAENITSDIDVVVYTAAIHPDHPELMEAKRLGIPLMTRAVLLGLIMKRYKMPVAISGTHGKTTVTSMISDILLKADADPTLSVGGILESIGNTNIRIGHSDYFVAEACEYTNSFLSFFPRASVILNVEADHLDFFKDLDDIENSFHKFASLSPKDGIVIIGNDIPGKNKIISGIESPVVTFGKDNTADYYMETLFYDEMGRSHFTVCSPLGKEDFTLKVPGDHNVMNALAAIALADYLKVDRSVTKAALLEFSGAKRRFEFKGEVSGVRIFDDYAHHPSEIEATLTAAKRYPHKKLWCIFQPHTYTRTKSLMDDFATALCLADEVILAKIYPARETDNLGISSATLMEKIIDQGTKCSYFETFEEIKNFVKENCAPDDMLITMGAGDVVNIADEMTQK